MKIKLMISAVLALATYLLDHNLYLVVVNTLIPLILIKDLLEVRDQVRFFVNGGEPVEAVRVGLGGIELNGSKIVGLRVLSSPFTIDQATEDALVGARAFISLLARYHAFALVSPRGDYVVGVDERFYDDLLTELTRLNLDVRRISGFELANAMRMRIRERRVFPRLLLVIMPVAPLVMASAYVIALFPILYAVHSIIDLGRRKYVVRLGFSNEVVNDSWVTRLVDNSLLRAETLGIRSRVAQVDAHVLMAVSPNDEVVARVRNAVSRTYSRFLMFRHIKYFLRYKDFENTIRRLNNGERTYSIYIASTAKFESPFRWKWVYSPSIMRIIKPNNRVWSLELDLVFLTPFAMQLTREEAGLAVIGRSVNNVDVQWSIAKSSPHVFMVGPTGSGKTTLAMSMVYQAKRRLGDSVRLVIIDPHGHTGKLTRLLRIRVIDLGRVRLTTRDASVLIDSIRVMNPLLSTGVEGSLLRMVLTVRGEVHGIDDLMKTLESLSRDMILREAYYNLYNSLSLLIDYYDHGTNTHLSVDDAIDGDVIFTMASISSPELIRYLSTLVILALMKRAFNECRNPPCPLRYIVVIDEAHNVLGLPSEYRLLGFVNPVEKMVREARKFGVALILLTQPPIDNIDPGLLENMGTTILLSGNSQYVSHVASVLNGISEDDALWLLSGRFKALVMRSGEPRPIRLTQLHVVKELLRSS